MRGLSKGEQSTLTNPRLQLLSRSGGFLVDIYSGSFRIEDIHYGDPVEVKASTPINTTTDKLGTGRYAIASGATTTWSVGTHRVVIDYKLSSTGPTHTQVIEFEILDPTDWPNAASYIGYVSTRRLLNDAFITLPEMTIQIAHRLIREYSQLLGQWTGRMGFHPIYATMKVDGSGGEVLFFDDAVIAIDTITDTDGNAIDATSYKVFNRHLDSGPDDRYNPKLECVDGSVWPEGRQNLLVTGVFGFTDPEPGVDGQEQVSLGYTPEELGRLIGVLISRRSEDPTLSDPTVNSPGSVRSMRTRDQAITFGGAAASSDGQGSMTGDPILDQQLVRFARPVFAAYAGGRKSSSSEPWPWY